MSEITLPSRISAIAPACFQESGLRQVFIPNNVTIIGDAAFNYCQYLEKVTFPVSLTSIGWSAFNACSSLTDICFYGTKTAWNTIKIADGNNFNDVTIQFNPTSYRITYKYVQSASHTNPEFCEFDKVLTLKNPTRTGYTFGGWYYEEDFSGKKVTSIPKTNREDVTLYAKWTPITYTISFNGNGNKSGEMASLTMTYDEGQNLPENAFLRPGYTFVGWNTAKNGTGEDIPEGEYVENLLEKKGTITLYAQWEANTYAIHFDANGGEGEMEDVLAAYDRNQALPEGTFTQIGQMVSGWNTQSNGKGKTYKPGTSVKNLANGEEGNESVTLYAMWTPAKYTVTFDPNGAPGKAKTQAMTYNKEVALTANSFKRTGYVFTGWMDEDGTEYENKQKVENLLPGAGNITLYAQWAPITYTLTLNPNGGENEQQVLDLTYDEGFNLPENMTRPGHTFLGWSTAKTGKAKYAPGEEIRNLANAQGKKVTLYALWEAYSYEVHFDKNDNQATGKMKDMTKLLCGKAYTLTSNAFKKNGYTFLGWSDTPEGDVLYTNRQKVTDLLVEPGTITLYAQWRPNAYTLTLDSNGAGQTLEDEKRNYDESFTLPVLEREGFDFLGWSTNKGAKKATYAPEKVLTNLTNRDGQKIKLYAIWNAHSYEIHFHADENSTGKMKDMTKLLCGKTYTLTSNAFKKTGYTFAGWATEENGSVAYANRLKFKDLCTDEGAVLDLYAVWTPVEYKITFKNVISPEVTELPKTFNIRDGLSLQAPAERPGMEFEGWYLDAKFKTPVQELPTQDAKGNAKAANITLYAKWSGTAHKYTIRFDGNGATSGKMADQKGKVNGKEYTLPNCSFKRTGYTFVGWALEAEATEADIQNRAEVANLAQEMDEVVTLYAVWKANS